MSNSSFIWLCIVVSCALATAALAVDQSLTAEELAASVKAAFDELHSLEKLLLGKVRVNMSVGVSRGVSRGGGVGVSRGGGVGGCLYVRLVRA